MKRRFKRFAAHSLVGMASITLATSAMAIPKRVELIVANNPAAGTTSIGSLYDHSISDNWLAGPVFATSAPSPQKTIGASKNRQSIVYRKADGITYLVDGSIGYGMGAWGVNFDAGSEIPIFLDANQTQLLKITPEEIEIEPTTNDVFVLGAASAGAAKQIFRIKTDSSGTVIATPMSFYNGGVLTPNAQRAFVNPTINGYKSGSIAFVPKTGGGQYLVFTHQSTVYSGICHWVYEVGTGTNDNRLNSVSAMSKCQKSSVMGGTFGSVVGGINTVYVGEQSSFSGSTIPAKFLMMRDNGSVYEVKGIFDTLPWAATVDPLFPAPVIMSNDLAWYRNYE